jgi:DNA-binding MarR family transcriptional regulator
MSDQGLGEIAALDRLIHEPARLVIVTILYTAEKADFLFLLRQSGLTKGNLSAHLARLEAAGYASIQKTYRGKIPQTIVALTSAGRAAFEGYRERLRAVARRLPEETWNTTPSS